MTAKPRTRARPQVSALESHLGFWLRMVSNQVSGEFIHAIEASGASASEWVALRRLWDADTLSPGDLVGSLGMTKGAVSKILARLAEKGFVARAADDMDARFQRVRLTNAGRAIVPQLAALADENERRFFGHLNAEEQAALRNMMENIVRMHQLRKVSVD